MRYALRETFPNPRPLFRRLRMWTAGLRGWGLNTHAQTTLSDPLNAFSRPLATCKV